MTSTATADPFATTQADPFDQPTGGGSFPKFEELEGKLTLIEPKLIQTVPDRFHRPKAGETQRTQERATCNVTVFEEDGTHRTYRGMYISQGAIVGQLQEILDAKNPNKPFILGVPGQLPNKASKDSGILTREALKTAHAEWVRKGGKGDKPGFFWGLDPFTADQAAVARPVALAMLNKSNPFA
jgi:hypothetical protein